MIRDITSLYHGLAKLRFLFVVLLIGATITQIVLNKIELIPLVIGALIYCLLGG